MLDKKVSAVIPVLMYYEITLKRFALRDSIGKCHLCKINFCFVIFDFYVTFILIRLRTSSLIQASY